MFIRTAQRIRFLQAKYETMPAIWMQIMHILHKLDAHYIVPIHLLCIFRMVSNSKSHFYVVKFYPAPPKHSNTLSSFCRWEETKCKGMKKMIMESRWRSSNMLTQSLRLQTNTATLKQITGLFLSRPIPSISIWFVSVSVNESVSEWSMMLSNGYVCLLQ